MKVEDKEKKAEHNSALTISDIAKLAGVSITTVSRVLNNNEKVSKATKRKVLKVIQDMDYVPSGVARGLATKTSNTVGLLIPDVLNAYYAELIKSIETVISENGFSLLLCITNTQKDREEYYINDMIRRRADGLIILSTSIENRPLISKTLKSMEIVSVEADIEGVDRINTSNEEGTYQVVRHLLELGHRNIAFIGYQYYLTSLQARINGYARALREYDVPVHDSNILEGSATGNSGYDMTLQLLESKNPPSAIHCMNEYLAMGAYEAVQEKGLKIPRDISISAFDGLSISRILQPKLTTAAMPIPQMGKAAAELLIQNILSGSDPAKKVVTFPTQLVIGDSTASK